MFVKHQARTVMFALSFAGVASVAGAVIAAPMENSPGSACVAAGAGSLNVRSDGDIENITSSTVTAVCPVDRPVGTDGTSQLAGNAWVIDQHPTLNVCCRVLSKNPSGAIVFGTQVCSDDASASYQNLVLPEITDGPTFSHFIVQCTLPPSNGGLTSKIVTYRNAQE